MMLKIEIIVDKERLERKIETLEARFPVQILAKTAFYAIVGCYVEDFSEDDKNWLLAMADARVLHRFRCKEREDR